MPLIWPSHSHQPLMGKFDFAEIRCYEGMACRPPESHSPECLSNTDAWIPLAGAGRVLARWVLRTLKSGHQNGDSTFHFWKFYAHWLLSWFLSVVFDNEHGRWSFAFGKRGERKTKVAPNKDLWQFLKEMFTCAQFTSLTGAGGPAWCLIGAIQGAVFLPLRRPSGETKTKGCWVSIARGHVWRTIFPTESDISWLITISPQTRQNQHSSPCRVPEPQDKQNCLLERRESESCIPPRASHP